MNRHANERMYLGYSGHETKSEDTAWIVEYDPSQDGGFRLFHPKQHCYLASSFRPYPDWDAERGNDTVAVQLKMIVEATCTRAVSQPASTLFVIEGTLRDDSGERDNEWPADCGWLGRILPLLRNDLVLRGYRIESALLSLRNARSLYGELHDVPRVLLVSPVEVGSFTSGVEAGVVALFCVAHLSWLARRQRRVVKTVKTKSHIMGSREQQPAYRIMACATFVYVHCVCYHVAGVSRPAGGRLMLVFAILGMNAILEDFKRGRL